MLFAPAAGGLLPRHCALHTKPLEQMCDHDSLGFPRNFPPVLISKGKMTDRNANMQLQKCKWQNIFFLPSWSLSSAVLQAGPHFIRGPPGLLSGGQSGTQITRLCRDRLQPHGGLNSLQCCVRCSESNWFHGKIVSKTPKVQLVC